MSRPCLSALQNLILAKLGELEFATPGQLQEGCGVKQPAISKAVVVLLEEGLIDGHLHTRPAILHLTSAGGRLLDRVLPAGRRNASWAVMSHACHLSEVQAQLSEKLKGFRILRRGEVFRHGLYPAFGEHGALDGEGKSWFVLLDDYRMPSNRISRCWTRRHTPNRKYWPDPTGRAWCDVVQRFLVVATDIQHAARHRAWILKSTLPADVLTIKPLWKT